MTNEEFKAIVNKVGEENILGLGFDNSSSTTFRKGEFSLANNLQEDISCLVFTNIDIKGQPYYTYKPIETVQSVVVKYPNVDFNAYDRANLRG